MMIHPDLAIDSIVKYYYNRCATVLNLQTYFPIRY